MRDAVGVPVLDYLGLAMTDDQTIERLEGLIDDLQSEVRQLTSRAEDAESLAEKYREVLADLEYAAKEALR